MANNKESGRGVGDVLLWLDCEREGKRAGGEGKLREREKDLGRRG